MRHYIPPHDNDNDDSDGRWIGWLFVISLLFYVILGVVVGVIVFS